MQRTWAKYGVSAFEFSVLLYCDKQHLLLFEQRALDVLKPAFNSCPVAGSTLGVPASSKAKKTASERMLRRIQNDPLAHKCVTEEANKATRRLWKDPRFIKHHRGKMLEFGQKLAKRITHNGVEKTRQQWAEDLGITPSTLDYRLRCWSKEAALEIPGAGKHTHASYLLRSRRKARTCLFRGEERTVTEVARLLGVTRQAILYQAKRKGLEGAVRYFEEKPQ